MPDQINTLETADADSRTAGGDPLIGLIGQVGARTGAMLRPPRPGRRGWWMLAACALAIWAGSGIYKVGPDEQGVVLLFGRWVATAPPGLHYRLPWPVSSVMLPRVTAVNELRSTAMRLAPGATPSPRFAAARAEGSRMLTGDENIVEADYSVLWKIKDAGAYLFRVNNPQNIIAMAAEAAVRATIGRNPIQDELSDRRQAIALDIQAALQALLDSYDCGIEVMQVQLQRVDPPAAVIDAFNDVQRARADQVRARNEADAYSNDIIPRARGQADHVVQDAEAYRTQAIAQAQGDVQAFYAAYNAWLQAPEVFAWRSYMDAMDAVLRRAARVVVDASGKGMTGVVPYMPMGEPPPRGAVPSPAPAAAPGPAGAARAAGAP